MRPLLLALALVVAACASGDSVAGSSGPGTSGQGGSGDGGAADGGSSSDGGSTGSPTTGPGPSSTTSSGGGSTTSGSPTTGVSSSSTGTPCDEDPCKLVEPQCGCASDEMCTYVGEEAGVPVRGCAEEGTRSPGQECSASLGDCAAGSLCVYVFDAGETLSCARFCENDGQCAGQGGLCTLGLTGVDDVKLCSDNCDLVSSSGCAIAGTKCGLGFDEPNARYFSVCVGAGAGVAQSLCNNETNQCAPGFDCFQTNEEGEVYRCFEWCSSAAPGCPSGQTCRMDFDPPISIGDVTYGVCSA